MKGLPQHHNSSASQHHNSSRASHQPPYSRNHPSHHQFDSKIQHPLHQSLFQEHSRHDGFFIQDDNNQMETMTKIEDITSPLLILKQHLAKISIDLQDHKLKSARYKVQSDQLRAQSQASLLTLMSMVQANERRKNEELEIDTTNELDNISNDGFEVETNEDFKIEEEVQDSTTQEDQNSPPQDDQGPTQQEDHHSPFQDDQ
jgi:hypothetical protein